MFTRIMLLRNQAGARTMQGLRPVGGNGTRVGPQPGSFLARGRQLLRAAEAAVQLLAPLCAAVRPRRIRRPPLP